MPRIKTRKETDRLEFEEALHALLVPPGGLEREQAVLERRRRARWAQDLIMAAVAETKQDVLAVVPALGLKWEAKKPLRVGAYEIVMEAVPTERVVRLEPLRDILRHAGLDVDAVLAAVMAETTSKRLIVRRVGDETDPPDMAARVKGQAAPLMPEEEWERLADWAVLHDEDELQVTQERENDWRRRWSTAAEAIAALDPRRPGMIDPFS